MLKKLITNPSPILRKIAKEVALKAINSDKIVGLVNDLKDTMLNHNGLGLAAPQINVSLRVIAVNTKDEVLILINPTIVRKSWRKPIGEEGCLSVPNVYGKVKRHATIYISAYNQAGGKWAFRADGLLARVIQHEIDHLDGVLFIDKLVVKNKKKQHGK